MKGKVKRSIVIMAATIAVVTVWLYSPALTPREAIWKYFLKNAMSLKTVGFQVTDSRYVDPGRGRQFVVKGIKGRDFGMDITFFYLKKNRGTWKVVSAGTGP